jgi:hypothetical protein
MTTIRYNPRMVSASAAAGVRNKYLEMEHAIVCNLFGCPVNGSPGTPREGARGRQRTADSREEAFRSQSRNGYLKIIRLAAIIPIVANR